MVSRHFFNSIDPPVIFSRISNSCRLSLHVVMISLCSASGGYCQHLIVRFQISRLKSDFEVRFRSSRLNVDFEGTVGFEVVSRDTIGWK